MTMKKRVTMTRITAEIGVEPAIPAGDAAKGKGDRV